MLVAGMQPVSFDRPLASHIDDQQIGIGAGVNRSLAGHPSVSA
jgi:hypothetical protein